MKDEKLPNYQILDCTIRDGGYLNDWYFDKQLVREVYRALSKSGVDFIEIGFRGTEKYFDKDSYGLWRFSEEEVIREVTANIKGAKLALMADFGKVGLDDFCNADESAVGMVRVAAHKDKAGDAIALLEKIREKGYLVSLNAMGYANYSEAERKELIKAVRQSELDYVYVADSYASMFPDQIRSTFEPLLEISHIKVGFHPHNNLQMAFANSLEAINCGVHIIDSTIYGMGRAAGNLPTEILISYMEKKNPDKYNSVPVLNIIDRYFVGLKEQDKWGYQLPYMLSSMFQCHPNYAKTLVDYKEYTIEDIWKALEYINAQEPVGFSKALLDNLISEGVIGHIEKTNDKSSSKVIFRGAKCGVLSEHPKVPYINRHKGRDFLIMANGPSLKKYNSQINKFITKYDPIILGANFMGGLFKPHYHAFNNKRRFTTYVNTVNHESKLFIGQYIPDEMIREYTDSEYEKFFYVDTLNNDFDINEGVVSANCRTISVLLMGVAMVMGGKRIFCVGMDGYMGKKSVSDFHFYKEADEKEDQSLIVERHRWNQKFIEQIDKYLIERGLEGIHILTPTSYKSFYKGVENYI